MSTKSDMRRKRQSLGAPITDSKAKEMDNLRRKGSRSKSIGPGGLDALQQTSGNRRASSVPSFQPRSILKPRASLAPEGNETENLIDLDFRDNTAITGDRHQTAPSADTIPGSKIALRTEEEQQAAAREREERERKEARRKSLGANRRVSFAAEATLYTFHEIEYVQDSTGSTEASRRASSAAQQPPNETNGDRPSENRSEQNRRRRSSVQSAADLDHDDTIASSAYSSDSDAADAVEEVEDHEDSGSSSDSEDSDGGTMMTIEGDETTSASIASETDDSEIDDALRLAAQHAGTQQLDNDDGFDDEEEVIPSFGWIKKGPLQAAPPSELPTPQPPAHDAKAEDTMDMDMDITNAGGRVINPGQQTRAEDDGDMSMDVTKAFGTIMGQNQRDATSGMQDVSPSNSDDNDDDNASMDFTVADGGVHHPLAEDESFHGDEEMSMELTSVIGGVLGIKKQGASRRWTMNRADQTMNAEQDMDLTVGAGRILSSQPAGGENQSPKTAPSRRRTINRTDQTMDIEQDMDLTVGAGRVLSSQPARGENESAGGGDGDATMDMDVTMAPGKILPSATIAKSVESADEDVADEDVTAGMEMDVTMASGKILPSTSAQLVDDATAGMDMTAAVGEVFYPQLDTRLAAKNMLQDEVNRPDSPSKPRSANRSPARRQTTAAASSTTEMTDSPSLSSFRGKSPRRSMPPAAREPSPATPQTPTRSASPSKQRATTPRRSSRTTSPAKSASPPKQRAATPIGTSSPVRPASPPKHQATTPKRTPSPAKEPTPRRITRSQSPQRKTPDSRSSQQGSSKGGSLWVDDPKTGAKTPAVILTPLQRKLSGRGVDREGLGSPRVSALLDRRSSIGESSETFSPSKTSNKRKVAFEDPRVLAEEVDQARRDDEEEESRRKQAGGQDEKEVTLNLKEMIASMSPKKNPLRGRKSLHVGSARGVLGKRPVELDSDEEEEWDGVKRLKGHQSSPVKNVRLQQPPSKEETITGRLTRPTQSMEQDKENVTPPPSGGSGNRAITPRSEDRSRGVNGDATSRAVDFDEPTVRGGEKPRDSDDTSGRVHLQDFLDMISVKFMELTTSKRRQTQMPVALPDGEDDMSLERCVVAGACTVPMLELYQHSCRELKKYISEGRSIVKEIESETFEDNPPLFREYMSATPDFKMLMDNQFKNVKTHARLLSKAMWYEWRMKLQDGLKEGLVKIRGEMEEDDESLKRQQELLDSVLPGVLARYEKLAKEHADLETYAEELAECDPEELKSARDELVSVESDIEAKKREIAELRGRLEETESEIEQVSSRKQECLEEIKEAEKIREECRGWSTTEINLHKVRVEALEKEHDWSVTGASGTQVSLAYKRAIELVFDVSSFKQGQPNSRIDVWYIATSRDGTARPVTPEREFFLQLIRDCVRALPQSRTRISAMLGMARAAWDAAERVAKDVRVANVTFPTKVTRTSDSSIAVVSSLMMASLGTRVEVTLNVRGVVGESGVQISVEPGARVCYGENFNVGKIAEFLAGKIGASGEAKDGAESWSDVFVSLHERLLARGRKEEARGE